MDKQLRKNSAYMFMFNLALSDFVISTLDHVFTNIGKNFKNSYKKAIIKKKYMSVYLKEYFLVRFFTKDDLTCAYFLDQYAYHRVEQVCLTWDFWLLTGKFQNNSNTKY